jgi:dTDP-4-dehydrorhamnose reductase
MGMEKQYLRCAFEFWGGVECTLNRVNEDFFDQLEFTGHYARRDDVRNLASLGLRKMRYPVLWEKHEPIQGGAIDWTRSAEQLNLIQDYGMTPIVGLVHHGSGPMYTNLSEQSFATGLASYAGKVAERFPWVEYYTPVNEPLTTARFSGLYGFWYPHAQNDLIFVRMLLNQLRGIVYAMREIRAINPSAKLVQTDDLAKTYAPSKLQYQADFENHRRWLSYDFLCGRVDRQHPLWDYLTWLGTTEKELSFFLENPCIPDVMGLNYYVTSERYLDPNIKAYPAHLWGGNHRHKYVDTEAIRVRHDNPSGLSVLLTEAWERFRLPIAVTEAFLSCNEIEHVRWLIDMCIEANDAARNGVDVRAVTFWGLLGEYGWNKVVTTLDGAEFETGAFDARETPIRETAVGKFIRTLASEGKFDSHFSDVIGWWKKEDRFVGQESCIEK